MFLLRSRALFLSLEFCPSSQAKTKLKSSMDMMSEVSDRQTAITPRFLQHAIALVLIIALLSLIALFAHRWAIQQMERYSDVPRLDPHYERLRMHIFYHEMGNYQPHRSDEEDVWRATHVRNSAMEQRPDELTSSVLSTIHPIFRCFSEVTLFEIKDVAVPFEQASQRSQKDRTNQKNEKWRSS